MPGARRILAIALIAMLVAAIAVGALLVALSRGFQRERLRQELEVAASGVLGAPVRIASLEGTLWPEAIARGVSLGPAAAPLAEIDEILLVFDRFDPLARRLVLSQARVRGLDVALDGAWPAPEAAPSGAVADAPNAATGWLRGLEIERVSLEESSGRWESDAGRFSAQLELQGRQAIWPAAPGSLPIARLAIRASVVGALRDEVESQLRIQGTLEAGRLALAILDLRVGDLELALEGEGRAAISDTAIEVEHLRLRSTPGRAQAPKVAADGTEGTLLEIAGGLGLQGYRALELRARELDLDLLSPFTPPSTPLEGRIDLDVVLQGPFAAPDLEGALVWSDGRVGELRDLGLRTTIASGRGRLDAEVHVDRAGETLGEVRVEVPLPFTLETLRASPTARIEARAESLELALLAPLLPDALTAPSGTAQIDLDLVGGTPPVLSGRIALKDASVDLAARGGAPFRVDALELQVDRFDLDSRHLVVSEIRGRGLRGVLEEGAGDPGGEPGAESAEDAPSPPVRIDVARLDLADSALGWISTNGDRVDARLDLTAGDLVWPAPQGALPVERLRARADLEVTLGGVASRLDVEGELAQGRIELSRLGLRSVGHELALDDRALAVVTGDGIEIEHLKLTGRPSELEVVGGIGWQAYHDLALRARDLDVAPLASFAALPFEMGGRLDLDLALSGGFARPGLEASLEWRDGRAGAMKDITVQGDLRTDSEWLRVELLSKRAGMLVGGVSAEIPYPFDAAGLAASPAARVSLKSDALDLALLAPLLPEGVMEPEGTARIDLRLRGGSPPELTGSVELEDGSIVVTKLGEEPIAPIEAHLALTPSPRGVLVEVLNVLTPLGVIQGEGRVDASGRHDLRVALAEVDVGGLARGLGLGWKAAGRFEASLQLQGTLDAPVLQAEAHWEEARLGHAVAERMDAQLEADGSRFQAEGRVVEAGRDAIRVRASGSVASLRTGRLGPDVEIRVDGDDFQLAGLAPILPRQLRDVAGRADVALEVRGGTPPQLRGSVTLVDGSLHVPLLNQTFAPILGRVEFHQSRIEPELRVGSSGAGARLSGVLELAESSDGSLLSALRPQHAELELELDHLPLARSRLVSADAHGSARATGPIDALSLTGEVQLERARLRVPDAEDPIFREIRVVTSEPRGVLGEAAVRPGVFEHSDVHMKLGLPRDSRLRGRGIELEFAGDVEMRKRPLGPTRYSGGVGVLRGRYTLYGKRFDVRTGRATFDGSDRFDPRIEVEAHHRVRDVTVIARLSGRLSSPELQLAGDPPMSETDVLSYLLVGRPADEMDSRGGGFDAAAAQLAAGMAANEALAVLPGGEWVDSVDFRMGAGGSPEEVGVGRYMTQDLFVRYGRGFGEDAHDRLGIELRLSDHWSVESDLSSDESAGADIIWGTDF